MSRSAILARLHIQSHGKSASVVLISLLLPIRTLYPQIGKTKFNMDPKFCFIAPGVRGLCEKVKPNMMGVLGDRYPSVYPRGEVMELPSWIAFDRQVGNRNALCHLQGGLLNIYEARF